MESMECFLDRLWSLHRPNGELRSTVLRLGQLGEIEGYRHPDETSWAIDDNQLVFCRADGSVTARSGEMVTHPHARRSIIMMREDNRSVQAHLLHEKGDFTDLLNISALSEALAGVKQHRAFDGDCQLDKAGFSHPNISALEVIEIKQATLPRLVDLGVTVEGPLGIRNLVILDSNMPKLKLTLRFHGNSLNILILDQHCRLRGDLSFEGHENLVVVGAACFDRDINLRATLRYHAAALLLGAGGSAGQVSAWIEGPGRSIQIGDDFLFSWGIWLRTADSHGLIDLDSGDVVNPSRSIVIGPHVWLGQDVMVMAGGRIGGGAVVGARSIVTKSLRSCCVAVGAPAKAVRQRTSWTRSAQPKAEDVLTLQRQMFEDP